MQPRFLTLHHSTYNKLIRLKREAEIDGEYRVAKRIHAVILNSEKKTSGEISSTLKCARSKVSEWLLNYASYGFESLLEGYRSGRPCAMTEKQKTILSDIVESGPIAYGFLSGVWTAIMISQIIEDEFQIHYDPRHVRRILHDLEFSVQRPKRFLAKADVIKQNKWKRYTYPRIKKKQK